MSLPVKDTWKKYRYRKIGQDYEDYDTANKYLKKKKAEETSYMESEEESRKRKLPARLISESDNDTDIESDIEEGEETYNTCKEDAYLTITRQFAAVSITPSTFCASEETKPGHKLSKKTIADINYLHLQIPDIKKYTVILISSDSYTTKKNTISIYQVTRTSATKTLGESISQVISKFDKQPQDITAIQKHLISAVDVDFDTFESLLPSGNRLNTSAEVE